MERAAKRFMKVGEFADALGCSRSKAYEIVKEGGVKSVTISGLLRIPIEEIERLAKSSAEPDAR